MVMRVLNNLCLGVFALPLSCCVNSNQAEQVAEDKKLTPEQEALIAEGWYLPSSEPDGELPKEYGIKPKYGQKDNYFDIEIGKGSNVAIKIVNADTDECIRYVYVPENSGITVQMIPPGKYYLKLAYGKDWMEFDNGDGCIGGKFSLGVCYGRSVGVFDFGKKNSSDLCIINYLLQINVAESRLMNNFETVAISESEFMQ